MLGFRFPAYVEGIEVAGYHLHFISDGPRPRRPRARLARQRACASGSIPPATSTSSCRRASSCPTPLRRVRAPRPTVATAGSKAAAAESGFTVRDRKVTDFFFNMDMQCHDSDTGEDYVRDFTGHEISGGRASREGVWKQTFTQVR